MSMIKTENLIFEYEKRDEEGNIIGSHRAIDEVNLDIEHNIDRTIDADIKFKTQPGVDGSHKTGYNGITPSAKTAFPWDLVGQILQISTEFKKGQMEGKASPFLSEAIDKNPFETEGTVLERLDDFSVEDAMSKAGSDLLTFSDLSQTKSHYVARVGSNPLAVVNNLIGDIINVIGGVIGFVTDLF